ncbi:MAG: hypothetical protein U0L88_16140 [Acutalibacteraceae bacterium]|nr:hypothetical protein [Acutalibacteraceae bacterium]
MTEQEIINKDTTISETDVSLTDTTPKSDEQVKIPIKFNKETKNLTLEEATTLAQKGLKFESIEKEYNLLKQLASRENKSIPNYIAELERRYNEEKKQSLTEKCGGNQEIAEHILALEKEKKASDGFEELSTAFPEIKSKENLPQEVLNNAELKGTLLLDEYLRYLLSQKRNAQTIAQKQREGEKTSTGSLINNKDSHTSETEEFLKGLWK